MQNNCRNWNLRTAIIAIGVVACLCFSIGEGLRLTPFPVAAIEEVEAFNDTDDSLRRYGPLNKPTRAQFRNKRTIVDLTFAPPAPSVEPPRLITSDSREGLDVRSTLSGSTPIGRAPPSC